MIGVVSCFRAVSDNMGVVYFVYNPCTATTLQQSINQHSPSEVCFRDISVSVRNIISYEKSLFQAAQAPHGWFHCHPAQDQTRSLIFGRAMSSWVLGRFGDNRQLGS